MYDKLFTYEDSKIEDGEVIFKNIKLKAPIAGYDVGTEFSVADFDPFTGLLCLYKDGVVTLVYLHLEVTNAGKV